MKNIILSLVLLVLPVSVLAFEDNADLETGKITHYTFNIGTKSLLGITIFSDGDACVILDITIGYPPASGKEEEHRMPAYVNCKQPD